MCFLENLPYNHISLYCNQVTENLLTYITYITLSLMYYSIGGYSMTISTVSWNRCKWGLGWKPCQIWSWWTWHRSARFRLGNPSSSSSSAIPVSLAPLSSKAAKTETLDRRRQNCGRMAFHSLFPSRSFGRGGMYKWRLLCKRRRGYPNSYQRKGSWVDLYW